MPHSSSTRVADALWSLLGAAIAGRIAECPRLTAGEWGDLMERSRTCGVLGLIHSAIETLPAHASPPDVLDGRWKRIAVCAGVREAFRFTHAREAISALARGGIRTVGLKGVAFRSLYPQPDLRGMGDIDLLVAPGDVIRSAAILAPLGWRRVSTTENVQSWWHESGTVIELHHALFVMQSGIRGGADLVHHLLAGARAPDPASPHLAVPEPEDSTVHLVLHMVKHLRAAGFGPRGLADLTLLLRNGVDAARLIERLEGHGAGRFGRAVVLLCHRRLGAPLAADLDATWAAEFPPGLLDLLACDVVDAGVHGGGRLDRNLASMAVAPVGDRERTEIADAGERTGGRVKALWRIAFPSRARLGSTYRYAWRRPALLPVAWVHRIARSMMAPPSAGWVRLRMMRRAGRMSSEKLRLLRGLGVLDF